VNNSEMEMSKLLQCEQGEKVSQSQGLNGCIVIVLL
jgi:hypothetical protein